MGYQRIFIILILVFIYLTGCVTDSVSYIQQADSSRMGQRWAEAADLYTKALTADPEARIAYYWRAECYNRLKEDDKAIADCKQFLIMTKEQPFKNRYLRERNKTIFSYRKWNLNKGILISNDELVALGELVTNDQTAGIGSQSATQGSTGGMSDE